MPDDYLFSVPQREDPYPYYRELRDEDPVHHSATERGYPSSTSA